MIAKVQEDNVQTLLKALNGGEDGDKVAMQWLEALRKGSNKYRRQRKDLCKLSEEEALENCMAS